MVWSSRSTVIGCGRFAFNRVKQFFQEFFTYRNRQAKIIQRIVFKDIGKKTADDYVKTIIFDGPGSVFAGGSAAEIFSGNQYFSGITGVIQRKILFRVVVSSSFS